MKQQNSREYWVEEARMFELSSRTLNQWAHACEYFRNITRLKITAVRRPTFRWPYNSFNHESELFSTSSLSDHLNWFSDRALIEMMLKPLQKLEKKSLKPTMFSDFALAAPRKTATGTVSQSHPLSMKSEVSYAMYFQRIGNLLFCHAAGIQTVD